MKTPLKSIEEELKDCRKALENSKLWDFCWHIHHAKLIEFLYQLPEERIQYILVHKPLAEQAARLRSFRPVKGKLPEAIVKVGDDFAKAWMEYKEAEADWNRANTGIIEILRDLDNERVPMDIATDAQRQLGIERKAASENRSKAHHDSNTACTNLIAASINYKTELLQQYNSEYPDNWSEDGKVIGT